MKSLNIALLLGIAVVLSCLSCKNSQKEQDESKSDIAREPSLCPPQNVSGPGTFTASEENPVSTIQGQISQLETLTPQIKFNATEYSAKLSDVWFEGAISGQYVIPTNWNVKKLSINDKPVTILNSDTKKGCLSTNEFGEILVLFNNSMMAMPKATIVMTEEQISKIKELSL